VKRIKLFFLTALLAFAFAESAAEEGNTGADHIELSDVVVTAKKLNPLAIPVKSTVVTAEEIKAKGAQTVDEAAKGIADTW